MGLPCGTLSESYAQDIAIVRTKTQWLLLIIAIAFLFTLPLFSPERFLSMLNLICITVIAVLGLNIMTGCCGQISVGHSAFVAIGAYASGFLSAKWGLPFWIALPVAGLTAGSIGLLFGTPAVRVKGFYLALSTVAAQFIVGFLIYQLKDFTGGAFGLTVPAPKIGNIVLSTEKSLYFLIMGITILMALFARNLLRSKTGRAFVAVRDNDLAAEMMGINCYRYKLLAFFIGCSFAGIAGSLWAFYVRTVMSEQFTFTLSIWYLGMLIVGGMGSTTGAIIGAVFLKLLDELVMTVSPFLVNAIPALATAMRGSLSLVIPGLIIMLFLVFEPRGLYHRWEIFKSSYRLWPYSY